MRIKMKLYIFICIIIIFSVIFSPNRCMAQQQVYRHDIGDVTGDTVYPVYTTLDSALSSIGSNQTTLVVNRELTISSNICIVPENVHLMFMKNGRINISAGKNLVINGPITAPTSSIFTCSNTIIEDCEDAWDEWVANGVTSSYDTNSKQVGAASVKIEVSDAAANGILVSESIDSLDLINATSIFFWARSSRLTNDNEYQGEEAYDFKIVFDDTQNCSSPILEKGIPQLQPNTWTRIEIILTDEEAASLTNITSIGIKQVHDTGEITLWIDDVRTNLGVRFGEGNERTIPVEWFLPSGYVTDGSVDYSSNIQCALNSILKGTIIFPAFPIKAANLEIINRSNYRVTGEGAVIKLFGDNNYGFKLLGMINNLQIDSLTIEGEGNSSYHSTGIGNPSGQNISDIVFRDLIIKDMNIGISVNADISGTYDKVIITRNRISNIRGTSAGQGYGIHLAKAYNCIISDNIIENVDRHSIYQGKGISNNILITRNIIKDHRKNVNDSSCRAAIDICRSSGVICSYNTFLNCYDGSIMVSHDTNAKYNAADIKIIGNSFINRKNAVPDIIIGEQLVPTTYNTSNVDIINNRFYTNKSLCGGGDNIVVLNGSNIKISENAFYWYNVNGAILVVEVGHDSFINEASHCTNIEVVNNNFSADGTDVSSAKGIYISSKMCTNSSKIRVKDNNFKNIPYPLYFGNTPTNQNTIFEIRNDINIDFPSIPANSCSDYSITINGVKPTSVVKINPIGSVVSGLIINAFSHSTNNNTIIVRAINVIGSAINPPNMAFRIKIEDE